MKKLKKNRPVESNDFEKEIFAILGLADGNRTGALTIIRELMHFRAQRYRDQEACEQTPAWACDHANEVPCSCPCASNCYCKSHTCKGR
jgi:hypothetical protein